MPYREILVDVPRPRVISEVVGGPVTSDNFTFATGNQAKLREFARILGLPQDKVQGLDLKVNEIQDLDPRKVVSDKAIAAWEANGRQPIIVEDTSLELHGLDGLPGTFVNQFTQTAEMRNNLIKLANDKNDTRATARVMLAIFDGKEVHIREGAVHGRVSEKLRGSGGFGWDDMFIPDGQEEMPWFDGTAKTFAEISDIGPELKDHPNLSMRTKALLELKENPFKIGWNIYKLPEPYKLQLNAIDETLKRHRKALKHAYNLEILKGVKPGTEITEDLLMRKKYYYEELGGEIYRIVAEENQPDNGIIITPFDTARDMNGKPMRLKLDNMNRPVFRMVGPDAVRMAIAARQVEFLQHHNQWTYRFLREMMNGQHSTISRVNLPSKVIEKLIELNSNYDPERDYSDDELDRAFEVLSSTTSAEVGYVRESTDRKLSRKRAAARGLYTDVSGIPTAYFSLGGMPPTSGHSDVLAQAALSYMDCYIPRNGIFAEGYERQIKLWEKAVEKIKVLKLPKDIEELCIKHIGICVGSDDPKKIAANVQKMYDAGIRLFKIYTTDPGRGVVDTAREIRKIIQDNGRIAVGPLVDIKQARKLNAADIRVNIIMPGHGAGENCTSLAGGGTANQIELLYKLSRLKEFNRVAIVLEGGTGETFGALLAIADGISLNKRGVSGGIETSDGLFVDLVDGAVGVPYHGSASPVTQHIESEISPEIAKKRRDRAGRLEKVEGVPNYMHKAKRVNSSTDLWKIQRALAGTALADQGVQSINELRRKIAKKGFNLRGVKPIVAQLGGAHRSRSL